MALKKSMSASGKVREFFIKFFLVINSDLDCSIGLKVFLLSSVTEISFSIASLILYIFPDSLNCTYFGSGTAIASTAFSLLFSGDIFLDF